MAISCFVLLLVLCSLYMLISAQQFSFSEQSDVIQVNGRVRGARKRSNVDIVLGGLFPIHIAADGGARCGSVRIERGLERMEAMLYSLDTINNNSTLLPGIVLGYDIRDTCSSENIGLDESIDLVITGNQLDLESCTTGIIGSGNGTSTIVPTSAMIGAAASSVSVPVATLLRLFQIPQVSYASSSARLNNRDRYGYFFRTISADNLQAEAMIDLCQRFNWTYVSTIYTNDFYGEPGIDQFRKLARERSICIDVDEGIDADFSESDFNRLANLLLNSSANVVVLFASQDDAQSLFVKINSSNAANGTQRKFMWLASDAWARSISVVSLFNESLAGLFGFAPYTEESVGFNDYFSMLTLESNQRNPWFTEFYEAYSNCKANVSCPQNEPITSQSRYKQGNFIPLVIDAVYSIAHSLQLYLDSNCNQPLKWSRITLGCEGQKQPLTGPLLLQYMKNVSFVSPTGRRVSFDQSGNVEGQYEIINYHKLSNQSFDFVSVGLWNGERPRGNRLEFYDTSDLQFGLSDYNTILRSRESQCQLCLQGQYRVSVQGSCCGTCSNCTGNQFSNTTTASECITCGNRSWGNNPLRGSNSCVPIHESFIEYDEAWAIVLMIKATFGLLSVAFVVVVMALYWNTPIVKSSGREQMILLLVGVASCFLSTFFFVSKPSIAICFFQRFSLWFCLSLILGALLVKLIRISRIFLRSKTSSSRPKFTEPRYQILFTLLIVFVESVIVLISMVTVYPQVSEIEDRDGLNSPTFLISCEAPHIAPLVILALYHTLLIIICNVLAVLSIRFPDNFNESKYVAFTTFALGLIWLAFTQTYIATSHEIRTVVVSFALNLSGFAVLLCMFGPRIVIMLFFPDRNTVKFSTHQAPKRSASFEINFDTVGCTPSTTTIDPSLGELVITISICITCIT